MTRGQFKYCPHHVDGQKLLSKLILTKISAALSQDPATDLACKHVLFFQMAQRRVPQDAMIPVVSILGQLLSHPTSTEGRDTLPTRSRCLVRYGPF